MKNSFLFKVIVVFAYFTIIAINFLANTLPIGGVTTGEASDALPNLFTPAGITFSIWGIIYLLLLGYTVYQFNFLRRKRTLKQDALFFNTGRFFLLNAFANIAWIFTWHYQIIWLSVLVMFVLLYSLIRISDMLNNRCLSFSDTVFLLIPFNVYFGWITIATIANITAFLVSVDWGGFGISALTWTIVILIAGAGIGILQLYKSRSVSYGLVLVWAYFGIWLKHSSADGLDGAYPAITQTVLLCIFVFIGVLLVLTFKKITSKTPISNS